MTERYFFEDPPERRWGAAEVLKPPKVAEVMTQDEQRALARRNVEAIKRQREAGLVGSGLAQNATGQAKFVRPKNPRARLAG